MKKYILLFSLIGSTAFAVDLEKGYSGIEFDTNMTIINNEKNLNTPLFNKYSLIKINNDFLTKTLSDDNTDRENIYKLSYTFSDINTQKGNGVNLMYSYSPNFEKRLGFNLNYTDINNEYNQLKTKGDFGQLNIFYNHKDYSDFTEFFITAYGGVSKEKDKVQKLSNNFVGVYTKYSDVIDNYYYNFFPKIYTEIDLKRVNFKEKTNKEIIKTKNDSINTGIGTELQKVIYDNDLKISITPIISYNHEFLGERKYKNDKDYFKQEGRIGVELKAEYNETSKFYIKYDYKKSFNTSKDMSIVSAGIKIML